MLLLRMPDQSVKHTVIIRPIIFRCCAPLQFVTFKHNKVNENLFYSEKRVFSVDSCFQTVLVTLLGGSFFLLRCLTEGRGCLTLLGSKLEHQDRFRSVGEAKWANYHVLFSNFINYLAALTFHDENFSPFAFKEVFPFTHFHMRHTDVIP